jgi:hypothetical protein
MNKDNGFAIYRASTIRPVLDKFVFKSLDLFSDQKDDEEPVNDIFRSEMEENDTDFSGDPIDYEIDSSSIYK